MTAPKLCLECGNPRGRRGGRGLCTGCYRTNETTGTLDQWPRTTRPRAEVVEDVQWLVDQQTRWPMAEQRLGMTRDAIERALYRAGRGDLVRRLGGHVNGA